MSMSEEESIKNILEWAQSPTPEFMGKSPLVVGYKQGFDYIKRRTLNCLRRGGTLSDLSRVIARVNSKYECPSWSLEDFGYRDGLLDAVTVLYNKGLDINLESLKNLQEPDNTPSPVNRLRPDECEKICEMYEAGLDRHKIAGKINRSYKTCTKVLVASGYRKNGRWLKTKTIKE